MPGRLLTAIAFVLSLSSAVVQPAQLNAYVESAADVYQDPAFAQGRTDGYRCGFDDGRKHERYDPARHESYRDADRGYTSGYGTRDAYKSNYREGFRKGYEEGYREGSRIG